jgi:SAM-dependent methyltransferase
MGLSRTTIQLLLNEASLRPFSGAVATLGRQHIYFTWDEFRQFARKADVPVGSDIVPKLHREPALSKRGYASDGTVLRGLGFSDCVTIDCSSYEDADEILDLNAEETPPHLQDRFDLVLDLGTMEHVFHTRNVLANMHRMVKTGGRIIHLSPAAEYLNHGFYNFSPAFFEDYYIANNYLIHQIWLCRYRKTNSVYSPVDVFDYFNRRPRGFEAGPLAKRIYTWTVAERRAESTSSLVPQQGTYRAAWAETQPRTHSRVAQNNEPDGTKADRLLKMTARWPLAQEAARRTIELWRAAVNGYRRRFVFPLKRIGGYG